MIRAYLRTLKNYLRTAKARHDLAEYLRAFASALILTAIITYIIRRWAT